MHHGQKHHNTLKKLRPTLDIGSHSNATLQLPLEAGAQRTLEAVGCRPLILIEAPASAYRGGTAGRGRQSLRSRGGALRRFDTTRPKAYGGIELQARSMYVGLLSPDGESLLHRNMKTSPETLRKAITP